MPSTGLLAGHAFLVRGRAPALSAAAELLEWLGSRVYSAGPDSDRSSCDRLPVVAALDGTGQEWRPPFPVVAVDPGGDPQTEWARSGGMWLTGDEAGPPLMVPGRPASRLRGAGLVLELLTGLCGRQVTVDGPALVGERAALSGLSRRGERSCGGSCRLLPTADGWLAVNLPRQTDRDLVGAWLGEHPGPDPWSGLGRGLRRMRTADAAERAGLLGLAAAASRPAAEAMTDVHGRARGQRWPPAPFLVDGEVPRIPAGDPHPGPVAARPVPASPASRPLVVELAGLWAGPLATSLLCRAGARVVKVEDPRRPDGTRAGPEPFFHLLNAGKESLTLDLREPAGRAALRAVLRAADVVVEGMRPRVLENLGIDRGEAAARGTVWVCITGYGISGPYRNRPAYGDDAAVAGGAANAVGGPQRPRFLADAFADPATGLVAAVAATAGLLAGSGHVVDVAMREVVGYLLAGGSEAGVPAPPDVPAGRFDAAPPVARSVSGRAPGLGVDSLRLAREFGLPECATWRPPR